jgi:hypothetical protein
MRRSLTAFALLALAACTPPAATHPDTAESAVQAIYANAQSHLGAPEQTNVQMSDDLKSLVDRAEAAAQARNEPFIEGDLALNCQDCTSVDHLVIGAQSGPEQEPAHAGHTWVQATFKLNGEQDRRVLWDMVQTPQGWRADNIISEGFDLRHEAEAYLANPTAPAGDEAP